jgi:hypothetical protein
MLIQGKFREKILLAGDHVETDFAMLAPLIFQPRSLTLGIRDLGESTVDRPKSFLALSQIIVVRAKTNAYCGLPR